MEVPEALAEGIAPEGRAGLHHTGIIIVRLQVAGHGNGDDKQQACQDGRVGRDK